MDQQNFKQFLNRCHRLFNKKIPSDDVVDLWFEELEFVPGHYLADIYRLFRSQESWPVNFPEKIKRLYFVVRKTPEKKPGQKGCNECYEGLIFLVKNGKEYTCRCQNCLTDDRSGIEAAYLSDLLGLGYELHRTMFPAEKIKATPEYRRGLNKIGRMMGPGPERETGIKHLTGDQL